MIIENAIKGLLLFWVILISNLSYSFAENLGIPYHASGLQGWNGFQIVDATQRCKGGGAFSCCDLKIPESFGFKNKRQLGLLIKLMNSHPEVNVECNIMPIQYYILDHILYLAIQKNDSEAAFQLLSGDAIANLGLDGELAEMFVIDYVIPVLTEYPCLKELGDAYDEEYLLKNICYAYEIELIGEEEIRKLISSLHVKKVSSLANRLEKRCLVSRPSVQW